MSATETSMLDFINALAHVLPDTMSPAARATIDRMISEARCADHVGNHAGVIRIMAKVRAKIMSELRLEDRPSRAIALKKYPTAQAAWAARVGMVEVHYG
jgi:hypothetical protein